MDGEFAEGVLGCVDGGGQDGGKRSRDEQSFAFDAGQMEELGDHGAERGAGHDDGAFGAKRPAGTDGDGAGERFEYREFRLDLAAVDEDGLNGFRNSVTADALGTV